MEKKIASYEHKNIKLLKSIFSTDILTMELFGHPTETYFSSGKLLFHQVS